MEEAPRPGVGSRRVGREEEVVLGVSRDSGGRGLGLFAPPTVSITPTVAAWLVISFAGARGRSAVLAWAGTVTHGGRLLASAAAAAAAVCLARRREGGGARGRRDRWRGEDGRNRGKMRERERGGG